MRDYNVGKTLEEALKGALIRVSAHSFFYLLSDGDSCDIEPGQCILLFERTFSELLCSPGVFCVSFRRWSKTTLSELGDKADIYSYVDKIAFCLLSFTSLCRERIMRY